MPLDAPSAASWPPGVGEMAARVREHDWASTALGPVESWPASLRTVVDLVLASGFPMIVLWGPELVQIYNDGYRVIMGAKHPEGLGQPTRRCWPEIWRQNAPIFERVRAGESVSLEDALYPTTRHGPLEDAWFTLSYGPLRDEGGVVAGVLVTIFETTERVLAERSRAGIEAALRQREADLARVQRIGAVGGMDIDVTRGLLATRQPEYLQLHGLPPDMSQEPHAAWRERVHPDDRERAERTLFDALDGDGDTYENQYRIIRPADGEVRWVRARADIERDPAGRALRLVGAHVDVTDEVRLQETLRASEARHAFLLKLSDALRPLGEAAEMKAAAVKVLGEHLGIDHVLYWEAEPDGEHFSSDGGFTRTGSPIAGRIRRGSFGQAVHALLRGGDTVVIADVLADPRFAKSELANLRSIGVRAYVAIPLVKEGRLLAVLGLAETKARAWTDDEVSLGHETAERTWAAVERGRAQAALRQSEATFRRVGETAPLIISLADADGTLQYVSPYWAEWSGRTSADFLKGEFADAVHPDDRGRILDEWRAATAERRAYAYEFRARCADGTYRWMDARGRPVLDEEGEVSSWVNAAIDIHDRRMADEALRDSEARYRMIVEGARDYAIFTTDTERRVVSWPAGAQAVFGFAAEEIVGRSADILWTPEDRAAGAPEREVEEASRTGHAPNVRWHVRKDGERVFIEGFVRSLRNGGPEPTGFLKIGQDVTERRRTDAALRASEARFRQFGEASADALYIIDAATRRLEYLSRAYEAIWGESREPVMADLTRWAALVHPEDYERVKSALSVAASGEVHIVDYRIVRADGGVRHIRDTGFPIRDSEGQVVRVGGIAQDVTALKLAELAVRESETRFRQFGEASADVLWILDAESRTLEYISPAFERIWGAPRSVIVNDLEAWASFVHPEDIHLADSRRALRTRGAFRASYRIIRPDGDVRWVDDTRFAFKAIDGAVARYGGIVQDVTERRRIERRADEASLRLRVLIEGIPQLVWRAVARGDWTWSSPQWTAFTGLSERASLGAGWLEAVHPEDRQPTVDRWGEASAESPFEADYRLWHASEGRWRWFQTRATPVLDDGGAVVEWLGTSTDVDDLRALQDRQRLLLAELQHRVRNILAVVRSTAGRTAETSEDLDSFLSHFDGRLATLLRTQSILTRAEDVAVDLEELVRDEFQAVAADADTGERVSLEGPPVRLRRKAAEAVALALHELTTNAVKYGALSVASGRIDVRWSVAGGSPPELNLAWRERGVPAVEAAPKRSGFGRTLIERALPYELGARTDLRFMGGGVQCDIAVPLDPAEI